MNWPWKKDPRTLLEDALQLLEREADPTSQSVIQKLSKISAKLANHPAAPSEAKAGMAEAIKTLQNPNLVKDHKRLVVETAKLRIQGGINSVIGLEYKKMSDEALAEAQRRLKNKH